MAVRESPINKDVNVLKRMLSFHFSFLCMGDIEIFNNSVDKDQTAWSLQPNSWIDVAQGPSSLDILNCDVRLKF